MAIRDVVELLLESPELRGDRRVGAGSQQHELRPLGQRVEQRMTDQVHALLAV